MCGIVGALANRNIDRLVIENMTDSLCHRGPDARDVFQSSDQTVVFGHTRLAILDLSAEANQPMAYDHGRLTIVFNGEIYNYKALRAQLQAANSSITFKTNSDTEVILAGYAQWGSAVCEKLDGMFAFAIWDEQKKEMFICRDRLGKKPLFYLEHDGLFIFGSEIKSLLRYPIAFAQKRINRSALYKFLHVGYIPEPDTIYEKIKKFPSASYGLVRAGKSLQLSRYWNLHDFLPSSRSWSAEDAFPAFKEALKNAVEKRMISDVPLGAFLSGGTDSSLVTAIASKLTKDKLKTFSIGFYESRFDESRFARKVASHLQTDHEEYKLHEAEAVGILETYLTHFDEPFADTSAVPTMLVSKLAKARVTVALTGDGGDELFLGYGAHNWADRLDNIFFKTFQVPLATAARYGNSRLKRISHLLEKVTPAQQRSHIFSQEQYFFTQHEIKHGLKFDMADDKTSHIFDYHDPQIKNFTPAEKQALYDLQYYLKDDLLVKVDRASMYYGLECRCPFLDHQVVEMALSFPAHLKRYRNEPKGFLKEILRDYLPDELVNRPKWGFSIPMARWLQNELSYLVERYLSKEAIEQTGVVNYAYVDRLKTSFNNGDTYLYNRLWVLIALHKWMHENA